MDTRGLLGMYCSNIRESTVVVRVLKFWGLLWVVVFGLGCYTPRGALGH
jgi:hypothetical protein